MMSVPLTRSPMIAGVDGVKAVATATPTPIVYTAILASFLVVG